jgi:hypothetical protein
MTREEIRLQEERTGKTNWKKRGVLPKLHALVAPRLRCKNWIRLRVSEPVARFRLARPGWTFRTPSPLIQNPPRCHF